MARWLEVFCCEQGTSVGRTRLVGPLIGCCVAALAASQLPSSAKAADAHSRKPIVAVTRHSGDFNGLRVVYRAIVKENLLSGSDGRPNATLVTTSYIREGVPDAPKRPVLFIFNGGPGASSTPLHLNGVGPVLRGEKEMYNNPSSLLDIADLVFIDPVGTGFSRNYTTTAGPRYWSRTGDASSVTEVISRWLKENGRERAPKYLMGESYGTVRATVILQDFQQRLHFDGVVLVSMVSTGRSPDDNYLGDFPSMAATARYWGKASEDKSIETAFEEAASFAEKVLAPAYAAGNELSQARRREVAQQMSSMIGIPADTILAKNLRLGKDDFMFSLIADRGLRTGQLDTRTFASLEGATKGAGGDPTMFGPGGLKRDGSQTIGIDEANAPSEPNRPPTLTERYFRETLGFHTPLKVYRGVNFDVNFAWNHEGGADIHPILAKAMQRDGRLRMLWTGGYFDLSTPAYAARVSLQRAGVPKERTEEALVVGAHSTFDEPQNRAVLTDALRRFMQRR